MTAVLAALQPAIDEAAEFGRCLRDLCPVQKRVLTALMHRLIAAAIFTKNSLPPSPRLEYPLPMASSVPT